MTSTLLTASRARAAAGCGVAIGYGKRKERGVAGSLSGFFTSFPSRRSSAYFRAIARRDVFLFCVFPGRVFDHRAQELVVALDPVGHIDPLRAVPLVDARHARAFMIAARELQRLHEAAEAELAQPRLVQVQVLDAPAHL